MLGKLIGKLKSFTAECIRVFKVTKKPGKDEYKIVVKVAGIGILLIGLIGFLVHIISTLVLKK